MNRIGWILGALIAGAAAARAAGEKTAEPLALRWEAESLQAKGAEPEAKYAAQASGGAYVYLPHDSKDRKAPPGSSLTVQFDAPPGAYTLRVRALAENGGSDSLFAAIDGQSHTLGVKEQGKWVWVEDRWNLHASGPHALLIAAREKARVDSIELLASQGDSAMPGVAIRQSTPDVPEPNGSRPLDINPPTFRWSGGWDQPYTLELARAADPWEKATATAGIRETFYRPLAPMEPGKWKWRVRAEGGPWYEPATFDVDPKTARWPIPDWNETFGRFSRQHPRILFRAEDLGALKEKAAGPLKKNADRWAEQLAKLVGAKLALAEDKPVAKAPDRKAVTIRRTASKKDAGETMSGAGNLALLAVVLDRKDFADEAIRRAMAGAQLDPKGYTSPGVSDFANGTIVRNVALVYDLLYDRLTVEQRKTLRDMLRARVLGVYKPKLEQQVYSAHGWQHVFHDLCVGALATWDEDPEMAEWLQWATKMFVAFYPWYGGADGASAEGASYYAGTDMMSSLEAVRFWKTAAGIDLAGNPWFRADPWFLIYGHPLSGPISGFGDHPPTEAPPDVKKAMAALIMADRYDNPYAAAYAAAIRERLGEEEFFHSGPSNLAYCQPCLLEGSLGKTQPKPLADLPAGRAFWDNGLAYVHGAIADPKSNVMFEFRSSPYGSFNHAHADQNSFNVAAYGEGLIIDSGHYTSYGDAHHYGWTVTTKAHNTILVDGQGQLSRNLDAYGSLVGFEQGKDWAWIMGDASTAYNKPPLKRFHRQAVWLGGGPVQTYVIFDSIAAADEKPHRFDWLLHSANRPEIDEKGQTAAIAGQRGQAKVTWLTPAGLRYALTDQFDPPAENWRPDKQKIQFPNQWHMTVDPREPSSSQRFLTVIQVSRKGDASPLPQPALEGETGVRVGEDTVIFTEEGVRIGRAGKDGGEFRMKN